MNPGPFGERTASINRTRRVWRGEGTIGNLHIPIHLVKATRLAITKPEKCTGAILRIISAPISTQIEIGSHLSVIDKVHALDLFRSDIDLGHDVGEVIRGK